MILKDPDHTYSNIAYYKFLSKVTSSRHECYNILKSFSLNEWLKSSEWLCSGGGHHCAPSDFSNNYSSIKSATKVSGCKQLFASVQKC